MRKGSIRSVCIVWQHRIVTLNLVIRIGCRNQVSSQNPGPCVFKLKKSGRFPARSNSGVVT